MCRIASPTMTMLLCLVFVPALQGIACSVLHRQQQWHTFVAPPWTSAALSSRPQPHVAVALSDLVRQRSSISNRMAHEPAVELSPHHRRSHEKRAFSILARIKPFSDFGKQRSSIRQLNNQIPLPPITDLDIVSAETRAMFRPIGQPLRWG